MANLGTGCPRGRASQAVCFIVGTTSVGKELLPDRLGNRAGDLFLSDPIRPFAAAGLHTSGTVAVHGKPHTSASYTNLGSVSPTI